MKQWNSANVNAAKQIREWEWIIKQRGMELADVIKQPLLSNVSCLSAT